MIENTVAFMKDLEFISNLNSKHKFVHDDDKIFDIKKYEELNNEITLKSRKMTQFGEGIYNTENRYRALVYSQIIAIPLFLVLGLFGLVFKKYLLILIPSIFILMFISPIFVLNGLNFSYFLSRIDMCREVLEYTNQSFPPEQFGLGYTISCINKNMMKSITMFIYEGTVFRDNLEKIVFELSKDETIELIPKGVSNRDTNRAYYYQKAIESNPGMIEKLKDGLQMLIKFEDLFIRLEKEQNCKHIESFYETNKISCIKSIEDNFDYIKFFFLSGFFYFPLFIGINRLVPVVKPHESDDQGISGALILKDNTAITAKPTMMEQPRMFN